MELVKWWKLITDDVVWKSWIVQKFILSPMESCGSLKWYRNLFHAQMVPSCSDCHWALVLKIKAISSRLSDDLIICEEKVLAWSAGVPLSMKERRIVFPGVNIFEQTIVNRFLWFCVKNWPWERAPLNLFKAIVQSTSTYIQPNLSTFKSPILHCTDWYQEL